VHVEHHVVPLCNHKHADTGRGQSAVLTRFSRQAHSLSASPVACRWYIN
jgi:hypothetical protein